MSDENHDPHFDRDQVGGMGGAGDASGAAPLPIPPDVPIERLMANDPLSEGGTGPITSNAVEPPEEPDTELQAGLASQAGGS